MPFWASPLVVYVLMLPVPLTTPVSLGGTEETQATCHWISPMNHLFWQYIAHLRLTEGPLLDKEEEQAQQDWVPLLNQGQKAPGLSDLILLQRQKVPCHYVFPLVLKYQTSWPFACHILECSLKYLLSYVQRLNLSVEEQREQVHANLLGLNTQQNIFLGYI